MLVTLGRNSLEPPSSLADDGSVHFPVEIEVSKTALLLIKEKNNRYSMIRVCISKVIETLQVCKYIGKILKLRGCVDSNFYLILELIAIEDFYNLKLHMRMHSKMLTKSITRIRKENNDCSRLYVFKDPKQKQNSTALSNKENITIIGC